MYCVGLTGSIASGKSTVAHYFSALNVDVINADEIAKELTSNNQPAFHKIVSHFGQTALTTTGELNRRYLRQLIFGNPQERLWLETLLHPLIRNEIKRKVSKLKTPYCLIEIPLLTDRSKYPYLNRVLLVQAAFEQQIARLITRDISSREDALAILATQSNHDIQLALADDILINTCSLAELQTHVASLHAKYLQYSFLK